MYRVWLQWLTQDDGNAEDKALGYDWLQDLGLEKS